MDGALEGKTIAVVPRIPSRGTGRKVGGGAGCTGFVHRSREYKAQCC